MGRTPVRQVARRVQIPKQFVCRVTDRCKLREATLAGTSSSMSVDSVFRTRSLGVAAEGLPDQYADGKAAKVWEMYIGDTQSRTQEYKSWVVSLLREQGVRRVLDVACGTG